MLLIRIPVTANVVNIMASAAVRTAAAAERSYQVVLIIQIVFEKRNKKMRPSAHSVALDEFQPRSPPVSC